jgi:iron(III) transport system permease protein
MPHAVTGFFMCPSGVAKRIGDPWPLAASFMSLTVATPIFVVISSLTHPDTAVWKHLWATQLLEIIWNTLRLMIGVGIGVFVLGAGLAWLVTMYRFPGQGVFQWLLILPLAMPAYVMGFVFHAALDYTGPIQTQIRALFGKQITLPDIASFGGITFVMTLVLYPYVYLLARTAFLEQSAGKLEAARALGAKPWAVFWKVALPLARPSVVTGVALALMEALADFGTVALFGYNTFTVAIYRVWFGMFNRDAATELASLLLFFSLTLLFLERAVRGRARFYQTEGTMRRPAARELTGWRAFGATAAAGLVVGIAFVAPTAQLLTWIFQHQRLDSRYFELLACTLRLGLTTALLTVIVAIIVAYGLRLSKSSLMRTCARIANMGYALPGSVVAVGVLGPLAFLDRTIGGFLEDVLGFSLGLIFTGSMAGLVFAYLVRFLAISSQTVEASLVKITPSMDMAARSLGSSTGRVLQRVHLPLIRRGLSAAAILVFVDVMKEMPATLLLRPFGYDTLAVRVWQFTSESLWEAAALPALTIVLAGLVPVILLMRSRGTVIPG